MSRLFLLAVIAGAIAVIIWAYQRVFDDVPLASLQSSLSADHAAGDTGTDAGNRHAAQPGAGGRHDARSPGGDPLRFEPSEATDGSPSGRSSAELGGAGLHGPAGASKRSSSEADATHAQISPEEADPEPDEPVEDARTISGRVLNRAGNPVPGIEITAKLLRLFDSDGAGSASTMQAEQKRGAGMDGYFQFPSLANGDYLLETTPTERYAAASARARAGANNVQLVLAELQRELEVNGLVTKPDGQPLEGVMVKPYGQSGAATYTGGDGLYTLAFTLHGSGGSYYLWFEREGYRRKQLPIPPADYEGFDAVQLDTVLEPVEVLATVSGTVRDTVGNPVPGQTVKFFSSWLKRSYRAVSDPAGNFSLSDVAVADDYDVSVRPGDAYRDYARRDVAVPASGLQLDIVLEPLEVGALAGYMVDVDGNPVPDFSLWLRSQDAVRQDLQVTGDGQGYFYIEEVTGGPLTFHTSSSPYLNVRGIDLSTGSRTQEVDLVLDVGDFELQGQVVDNRGRPLAGSEIYLYWNYGQYGLSSASTRMTTSDFRGDFRFTQLGPGMHRLVVKNVPGQARFEQEFEVGFSTVPVLVQLQEEVVAEM